MQSAVYALIKSAGDLYLNATTNQIIMSTFSAEQIITQSIILPVKITTQTIIAELSNVNFNENDIEISDISKSVEIVHPDFDLSTLMWIKTKRFHIQFDCCGSIQFVDPVQNQKLGRRPMNSSILFIFKSKLQKDKLYYLRTFRNGKVQIPGVTRDLSQSEVLQLLQKVSAVLKVLLWCHSDRQVSVVNLHIVMINFRSLINVQNGYILDVVKMMDAFQQNKDLFQFDAFKLVQSTQIRNRPVLHLKFQIVKQYYKYEKENMLSTSRKRSVKTITVQIMQSGKILLQGCVQDNKLNHSITMVIDNFLQKTIHMFVVKKMHY